MQDDQIQELTRDHTCHLRTQAAPFFKERCAKQSAFSQRTRAVETGHEQTCKSLSTWGTPRNSQESLGETVLKLWVSTVTSQSFVLSGCCSLGTSVLNKEGSHVSFQGNRDAHLCSETFKAFWSLDIITGVLHFAEQARELPKQLYISLTVRVK